MPVRCNGAFKKQLTVLDPTKSPENTFFNVKPPEKMETEKSKITKGFMRSTLSDLFLYHFFEKCWNDIDRDFGVKILQ